MGNNQAGRERIDMMGLYNHLAFWIKQDEGKPFHPQDRRLWNRMAGLPLFEKSLV